MGYSLTFLSDLATRLSVPTPVMNAVITIASVVLARDFRAEHGFRLRIATKYHRLVRAWLSAEEVADYQLVDSQGATEGTVANLTAEAIADITSSGETLRANHLKIIGGEPILRSQATLLRSLAAGDEAEVRAFALRLGL